MDADLCAGPPETMYKPGGHVGRLSYVAEPPRSKKKERRKNAVDEKNCVEDWLKREGRYWERESKNWHGRCDHQQTLAGRMFMTVVRADSSSKERLTLAQTRPADRGLLVSVKTGARQSKRPAANMARRDTNPASRVSNGARLGWLPVLRGELGSAVWPRPR